MRRFLNTSLLPLAAGLALRLLFVLKYPCNSDDAQLYEQFAENWLKHGIYGMLVNGRLTCVDMRMPGYPAFLSALYFLTGRTGTGARLWVMLTQVVIDLLTCLIIAALAAVLCPGSDAQRRRVRRIALWLAATCPFIANYAAVPLTEVLATFFTAAALLLFVLLLRFLAESDLLAGGDAHLFHRLFTGLGMGAALLTGLGTLVRPETPLLLFAAWLAFAWVFFRKGEFAKWPGMLILTGAMCIVPLVPWAVRNAVTLHEVQFLAPRYSELPSELVPHGFMSWEKTWLYRFRDVYLVSWKLNDEPISIGDIPPGTFDSAEQKLRVAALLDEYNESLTLSAEEDSAFGQMARERTALHPLRTYLNLPVARAAMMWLTPRIELLPFSGKVLPLAASWEDDPVDLTVTVVFFFLNILYVALAVCGAVRLWRAFPMSRPAILLFAVFILLRTAFLTTLETPEPRYVIVCYPAILTLAAHAFARSKKPA